MFTRCAWIVSAFIGTLAIPAAPAVEEYAVPHVRRPPSIDGKLDDAAWTAAPPLVLTNQYRPDYPVAPLPHTLIRLCWDADSLYAAFICEDDDVWSFSDRPDSTLWLGDAVELFIKPVPDQRAYFEFVVAPNGALYDAAYPSRGAGGGARFKAWSSGALVAADVDGTDGDWRDTDRGFVVEMAIPWAAFAVHAEPPREGDAWTFGAFRCEVSRSRDDPLLLMSIPQAGPSGFHSFEFYGILKFRSPDTTD